jgi:hypothetical protein
MKNFGLISRPASSPVACLSPPFCWNSITRKPSKPASRRALRYSVAYMPKRQGPQAPAVRKTYFCTISACERPSRAPRSVRNFTRLPTVK